MTENVITIDAMAPLIDAVKLMLEKNIRAVVILPRKDSDGFGILTFKDVAEKIVAGDENIEMLNVFDLMSTPCINVRADLGIKYAAKLMTERHLSRLIVTEGNTLLGIISQTDLVKSLIKKDT
jgi:CBS domain-containing protein